MQTCTSQGSTFGKSFDSKLDINREKRQYTGRYSESNDKSEWYYRDHPKNPDSQRFLLRYTYPKYPTFPIYPISLQPYAPPSPSLVLLTCLYVSPHTPSRRACIVIQIDSFLCSHTRVFFRRNNTRTRFGGNAFTTHTRTHTHTHTHTQNIYIDS